MSNPSSTPYNFISPNHGSTISERKRRNKTKEINIRESNVRPKHIPTPLHNFFFLHLVHRSKQFLAFFLRLHRWQNFYEDQIISVSQKRATFIFQ